MKNSHNILTAALLLLMAGGITAGNRSWIKTTSAAYTQKSVLTTESDTTDTNSPAVAEVPEQSIIDEVIWVVGDEAILKSDVEATRLQAEAEGVNWDGDPDAIIPEDLAVQKLFLHQAAIDSIEVSEGDITSGIEAQINWWIQMAGSKEKVEEYRKQSISQMRQQLRDDFRNRQLVDKMKKKLVEDVTVSPADVRNYFKGMPADSLPFVPTEVEVEIITRQPKLTQEEINAVKDELREYTDRVTRGEVSFATLARFYSEDEGSARYGGEMDYVGRGYLDPAFANVAFNLTDPKKISKIVESEFGYHIIQLIDKRGDKIKVRHILRKPKVTDEAMEQILLQTDTMANEIREGKIDFETAASYFSDDKDTRNNYGLMAFTDQETGARTSRFQMKDLPTEVARVVENMEVGEISKAFTMVNNRGKKVACIVKLKSRVPEHRATITEDFQVMSNVVLHHEQQRLLHEWVEKKIKSTYVRMKDRYKQYKYKYDGWVR